MSTKIIKNKYGISLIEVIAAIMIITVGMIGVSSLVIQNIQVQYINKNVLMASGLAQEGIELVRNIRDLNWLTDGNTWKQSIVDDGTYTIDYGGLASINPAINSLDDAGARLYVNGNGFYTHMADGNTPTNFYRLITIEEDPGGFLDVKCTIRWKDGAENHNYTVETYLYDWR